MAKIGGGGERGEKRKHNKGEQHTPSKPFDSKEEVASEAD